MLEVAETLAGPVLAGRRHPPQRTRHGVEVRIQLPGIHAELAQVVADHHAITQAVRDLARSPDAARVRATEELVRHRAVVHAQPVRKGVVGGPCRGQRTDAGGEADGIVEPVAEVAGDDDLGALPLAGVAGPGIEQVAEVRVEQPALEAQVDLLQLQVLAQVERPRAAEGIRVGALEGLLVEVSRVGEHAEIDFAQLVAGQHHALAALVAAPLLVSRRGRRHGRGRPLGRLCGIGSAGPGDRHGVGALHRRCTRGTDLGFELADARIPLLQLLLQLGLPVLQGLQAFLDRTVSTLRRAGQRRRRDQRGQDGAGDAGVSFAHVRHLRFSASQARTLTRAWSNSRS